MTVFTHLNEPANDQNAQNCEKTEKKNLLNICYEITGGVAAVKPVVTLM